MNEEPGRDRGTAKYRMVLAIACVVESGIALVLTIALVHMAVSGMGTSSLGRNEIPSIDVAAFVTLPLLAVAVGALPAMLRDDLDKDFLTILGISALVCFGAALVYFPLLLIAGALSVRIVPDTASLLIMGLISAVPFVLIPLLVSRWT